MCDRNIYCGKRASNGRSCEAAEWVTDHGARLLCSCVTESDVLHQRKSANAVWQKHLFAKSVGPDENESQCTLLEPWQLIPLSHKPPFMTVIYWTFKAENRLWFTSSIIMIFLCHLILMEYDVIADSSWCLYNPAEELLPGNKTGTDFNRRLISVLVFTHKIQLRPFTASLFPFFFRMQPTNVSAVIFLIHTGHSYVQFMFHVAMRIRVS